MISHIINTVFMKVNYEASLDVLYRPGVHYSDYHDVAYTGKI